MEMITNSAQKPDLLEFLTGQIETTKEVNEKASESGFEEFFNLFKNNQTVKETDEVLRGDEGVKSEAADGKDWDTLVENIFKKIEQLKSEDSTTPENGAKVEELIELIQSITKEVTKTTNKDESDEGIATEPNQMDETIEPIAKIIEIVISEWAKEIKPVQKNSKTNETDNLLESVQSTMANQLKEIDKKEMKTIRESFRMQEVIEGNIEMNAIIKQMEEIVEGEQLIEFGEELVEFNKKPKEENMDKKITDILDGKKNEIAKTGDILSFITDNKALDNKANPVQNHRNNILSDITKELLNQPSSTFKMIHPEKIIIQLKPMELGHVEVIIERVNGEITVHMKSDNTDVQELLDGMVDEIKEEVKMRAADGTEEQSMEKEQDEKTKEEYVNAKKQYEKEEDDSSFDKLLESMLGGYNHAKYSGYSE